VPSVSHLGPTHLGLDVHKDTISVAILAPDRDGPDVDRIPHDEASVRRLVGRFPIPAGCEPAMRPARPASSGTVALAITQTGVLHQSP
jgi:hypothetical protein